MRRCIGQCVQYYLLMLVHVRYVVRIDTFYRDIRWSSVAFLSRAKPLTSDVVVTVRKSLANQMHNQSPSLRILYPFQFGEIVWPEDFPNTNILMAIRGTSIPFVFLLYRIVGRSDKSVSSIRPSIFVIVREKCRGNVGDCTSPTVFLRCMELIPKAKSVCEREFFEFGWVTTSILPLLFDRDSSWLGSPESGIRFPIKLSG